MSAAPTLDATLQELRGADSERGVAQLVRRYVDEAREHLAAIHRSSESGRAVNEANSDHTDRLLRRLYSLAEEKFVAEGGETSDGVCAVAVGGYARREMAIHSDIDLLLLYRGEITPYVSLLSERLQYWLWDAGVSLGCATRTIADTVSLGRKEETVRTSVLMARFLCGDGEFFHDFVASIRKELLPDVARFITEQIASLQQRHMRYGESLFLLQPNVKEGAGALRDYHTAYWVARAAQQSARSLDDFLHDGLLTESEMREYAAALDFLWRVRNELHLKTGRRTDQMNFELQEHVASQRGYRTGQDNGAALPVELLMADYYRHARAIENYSAFVIEQCAARVTRMPSSGVIKVEDGFRLVGSHLEIPHATHLREQPLRMLRVFEIAQHHDVALSRMARRLVRENLDLVDDELRGCAEGGEIFLRILDAKSRVMRALMDMNEVGVLGAYLPEWQHIVFRWQHMIYHTYTVDVHSIFLIEQLRRLGKGEYEEMVPDLSEMIGDVDDRPTLFLGCLLHDIGKGLGGDHSTRGTERARECMERMGIETERKNRVLFLVQHHLRMSHLAQRRDLSGPKVLLEFARLCGDRENLRNLYLLTFADLRASSEAAWTDWKGQLLRELFERTADLLETGADDTVKAMERIEARVAACREGARAQLVEGGVEEAEIDGLFEVLPRRYFVSHTPDEIARHAEVVFRYEGSGRLATAFRDMRDGFSEFLLCTKDVHGLYARVAGVLMARGLNILGSHVYTTYSGLALEVYRLSTPRGGRKERDLEWRALERALGAVLEGESTVEELLRKRRRPVGSAKPLRKRAATIQVSNSESDFYTIVDVTADDHMGLLYELTTTIAKHDLEIYISKASTVQDQVMDTFYLKDRHAKKVRDPEVLAALQRDLVKIVERGLEREDD